MLQPDRVKYVILDFKLLTWKYMNFTKKFDENTRIFTVKVSAVRVCIHLFLCVSYLI